MFAVARVRKILFIAIGLLISGNALADGPDVEHVILQIAAFLVLLVIIVVISSLVVSYLVYRILTYIRNESRRRSRTLFIGLLFGCTIAYFIYDQHGKGYLNVGPFDELEYQLLQNHWLLTALVVTISGAAFGYFITPVTSKRDKE